MHLKTFVQNYVASMPLLIGYKLVIFNNSFMGVNRCSEYTDPVFREPKVKVIGFLCGVN